MKNKVFFISNSAAVHIKYLINRDNHSSDTRLRIMIEGGGCSGFQYNFNFDNNLNDDDTIFKHNDIEIVIDEVSLKFLNNAKLDYVDELGVSTFKIDNPNAVAACGCGNSFSTDI